MLLWRYFRGAAGVKLAISLKVSRWLVENNFSFFAKMLHRHLEVKFGVYISPFAKIGENIRFPHPVSIVIGAGVVVGKNCTIYQGVTLGGARIGEASKGAYPTLEDEVVVYSGAQILGGIRVGSGSQIGANAVVISDIPAGAVAVGVPARLTRKKEFDE